MARHFGLLAGILLVLCRVSLAEQSASNGPPAIHVSGTGEVSVAPDEVQIHFGVETRDEKLEVAKKQNDERVAAVLQFLKASGIEASDVQTNYVSFHQQFDSRNMFLANGYVARRSIGVRLHKISDFERIYSGVVQAGANQSHGVELRSTEARKHREKARQMALQAAKAKATAMAAELGAKVGHVQSIAEKTKGEWQNSFSNVAVAESRPTDYDSDTFAVGQISITATVDVTFLLQ